MAKIKYTESQIQELINNEYINWCSNKSITFTKECKIKAVKLRLEKLLSCKEVFRELWFPEYIINTDIPNASLNRWIKNNHKWKIDLKRWRKRKEIDISKMTKDEELEYLRTKVAVLEELKKLVDKNYP